MSLVKNSGFVDPAVFEALQAKIDDDTAVRDQIRDITQELEKQEKKILAHLVNAQSLPASELREAVASIEKEQIGGLVANVGRLAETASKQPYYKFNQMWSRVMQEAIFAILLAYFNGGCGATSQGSLLNLEGIGKILNVPTNVKDSDTFHVTTEEYLQALVSLVDELARLSRTAVTMGDYARPIQIAQFVKDVHAGFQVLNLKNDSLRKRSDGIKYRVREVEDVVYDLSLRGLVPK